MPGSPRLFSLCRSLAARPRLTLVTLSRDEERYRAFCADPMTAGVFDDILVLPTAPPAERFGHQMHQLRQQAYFITRYRTPRFHAEQCSRIRELFVGGGFDAIFADGLWVAQYVEDLGIKCPAVIDLHDSMTLLVERMRKREPRRIRRIKLYFEGLSIGRSEAGLARTFDTVVTNSPIDEEYLKTLGPALRTLTIPNGVDSDFFGGSDAATDSSKIVFTGVMSYGPNDDAALFFADAILPIIRERRPEMQFWIVGKDPGPKVTALAERPGIHVTGGVPDIRP